MQSTSDAREEMWAGQATGAQAKGRSGESEEIKAEDETAMPETGSSPASREAYIAKAKRAFSPMGAPDELCGLFGAIMLFVDTLDTHRGGNARAEADLKGMLTEAMSAALDLLVNVKFMHMSQVGALAMHLRKLAPVEYDNWVGYQFASCQHLATLSTRRNAMDMKVDGLIEEALERDRLSAGVATGAECLEDNFVVIFRGKLIADLGVTTTDEEMEVDLALGDFLIGRRIRFAAQSHIGPIPTTEEVNKGLAMLKEARAYDDRFRSVIDRIRARRMRKAGNVQVHARGNARVQVLSTGSVDARRTDNGPPRAAESA